MNHSRIEWVCGHVWHSLDTKVYPNKTEDVIKFGCPYCKCKTVNAIEFHSIKKEDKHGV